MGQLFSIFSHIKFFRYKNGRIYFYAAFMVSLINASVLLSVVGAASDTAIVCFAEAPADLEENHPELSAMMHQTYAQAWPNVNFRHEVV